MFTKTDQRISWNVQTFNVSNYKECKFDNKCIRFWIFVHKPVSEVVLFESLDEDDVVDEDESVLDESSSEVEKIITYRVGLNCYAYQMIVIHYEKR